MIYTFQDVICFTGINPSKLSWLVNERVIIPNNKKAHGRGTRNYFDIQNLREVAVARELFGLGCKTKQVKIILDMLNSGNPGWDSEVATFRMHRYLSIEMPLGEILAKIN